MKKEYEILIHDHTNEFSSLIIAISVLLFLILFKKHTLLLPHRKIAFWAFMSLFLGLIFTLIEHAFWKVGFNFIEHMCYLLNSILLAVWCHKTLITKNKSKNDKKNKPGIFSL